MKAKSIKQTTKYILLIVFAVFVLIPVLWMLSTALKTEPDTFSVPPRWIPSPVTLGNFKNIMVEYPFGTQLKNSFLIVGSSTVITLVFSTFAGYGITRFKFNGKAAFMTFLLISQMFPSVMLLVPFYSILKSIKLINTYLGVILVYISITMTFATWMITSFFKSVPMSLDEAARIDGCSRFQAFLRVIMPLTLPGMISVVIYSFVTGWNEYMFAATLTTYPDKKTITVGIAELSGQYRILWNDMMAASLVASLPLIVTFIFLQKYFISGMTAGAVKQ